MAAAIAPIIVAVGVGATTAAILAEVIVIAVGLGISYLAQTLFSSKPAQPKPSDGQVVIKQAAGPRTRSYGRVKVGGTLMFANVSAGAYGRVIAMGSGEIDAVEEHWIDDHLCTLSGSAVTSAPFVPGGASKAFIEFGLGAGGGTFYSALAATYPALWTSAHLGKGIPSAFLVIHQVASEDMGNIFPQYGNTQYRQVQRAAKVRVVSGGAFTAPVWSPNAAAVICDYLTHPDGLGLADSWILNAAAEWEQAIADCADVIGGEYRYLISNTYNFAERPADVLTRFLTACDGSLFPTPDRGLVLRVGKWIAPTVTIDSQAIIGFSEFGRGRDVLSTANTIRARYTSPDHDYMEQDADPWIDAADVAERGEYALDLDLFCVTSHGHARRMMKLAAHRSNPNWVGTLECNLCALPVMGERYINVVIDELGVDETFEVMGLQLVIIDGSILRGVTIRVASLSSAAYDLDVMREAGEAPPVPPVIVPGPRSAEHLARIEREERERMAEAAERIDAARPAEREKEDA